VAQLLRVRHEEIVPRLAGTRSIAVAVLDEGAVHARWRMGDGSELSILVNLGEMPVAHAPLPDGRLLFSIGAGTTYGTSSDVLHAYALLAILSSTGPDAAAP